MDANLITIEQGLPESLRERSGTLFEQAFSKKMEIAIPDQASRRKLIDNALCLEHALGAFASGKLIGILGLKSNQGGFTGGGTYWSMIRELGLIEGNRASLILSVFERTPQADELIIECISVDRDFRGCGVGSQLIVSAIKEAKKRGFSTVSLEVVDTNPRAQKLYEQQGFRKISTEHLGVFSKTFGFGAVSILSLPIG